MNDGNKNDLVRLREVVATFEPDPDSQYPLHAQMAVKLAAAIQERAITLQTPQERRQQSELDRMIHNQRDKATLTQLTDQAFRSGVPHRAADQLIHILDVQGVPRFFTPMDRALLKGFQSFGSYLPGVAVPLVKEKMHHETANVILPADDDLLADYLRQRREEGVRMNVNYLGEALLGESEANVRLQAYLTALQVPEIEVISVKISTLYSQISPIARQHSVRILCDRMELLYRAAAKSSFTRFDGSVVSKFVYMDMEEYRDMGITAEVFMKTLERPGLENVHAGIVLQAYIPDSFQTHCKLNQWARQRVASGGAPITIRIVKGANMEMERFEATLYGWPQAPFKTKSETDANYKRMLHTGFESENLAAVRMGIASHNVFEVAYAMVLALENDAFGQIQFEMLEGMANHQRRAILELASSMLLYAPACKKDEFINAIGYLIRRLDENTGAENFLRYTFKLRTDSEDWRRLETAFLHSFDQIDSISSSSRRTQNRNTNVVKSEQDMSCSLGQFENEADTDFSLAHNAQWAASLVESWEKRCDKHTHRIPLVIDGREINGSYHERDCIDPSRPGVVIGRYRQATSEDIERAIGCAQSDADGWRSLSPKERSSILAGVAQKIREARGALMGAALADGGKTLAESDPEVSEAIDFVEFYSRTAQYFHELPGLSASPRGVVVVVSPWNFPLAIPCGGISAALAAGNTVILKPASDTVMVAYLLCECFWRTGVSRKALQFAPCEGATQGQRLVTHNKVDSVILTGGTETALNMLAKKPGMRLLAETGGKNATIVTSLADRDLAIKHVVHSAFSHSGQKCSATSLLILEEEVYHDQSFRQKLCDAVASLHVGSAWDLKTRMGPLIRPPRGELERGLKELEPKESWAVMPRGDPQNPHLYSPGVKWDVQPGSFTHTAELFGPVLGVMRAKNLHEAIELVNQTGYGLTSGLQSLDDREQDIWQSRIRAGNLYINRPTTGAVVLRQPFGGMEKSAFGPGIKAGGPNYVAQFMRFREQSVKSESAQFRSDRLRKLSERLRSNDSSVCPLSTDEADRIAHALQSYDHYMQEEFGTENDHFRLIGQDNIRRYLPIREMRIRLHQDATAFDLFARAGAACVVGCRITISLPSGYENKIVHLLDELTHSWAASIEFVEESDRQLADVIRQRHTDRVRYSGMAHVPKEIRIAASESGVFVADEPISGHGRVELLWYCEEQSISMDYHRYGNLGTRAEEKRMEPL